MEIKLEYLKQAHYTMTVAQRFEPRNNSFKCNVISFLFIKVYIKTSETSVYTFVCIIDSQAKYKNIEKKECAKLGKTRTYFIIAL